LLASLKSRHFTGAAFCIIDDGDKLHLGALVGTDSDLNAGKLIQSLAPIAGGKGGGKPDLARGAAPQREKLSELEASARKLLL
jgi:alanyl-tRNA synthetase